MGGTKLGGRSVVVSGLKYMSQLSGWRFASEGIGGMKLGPSDVVVVERSIRSQSGWQSEGFDMELESLELRDFVLDWVIASG